MSTRSVPSCARMNPQARLRANVFELSGNSGVWRLVIIGPWLYVRPPRDFRLRGFTDFDITAQAKKHLFGYPKRLLLTKPSAAGGLGRNAEPGRFGKRRDWATPAPSCSRAADPLAQQCPSLIRIILTNVSVFLDKEKSVLPKRFKIYCDKCKQVTTQVKADRTAWTCLCCESAAYRSERATSEIRARNDRKSRSEWNT